MVDVWEVLRADAELAKWLTEMEALEGPEVDAALPAADELPAVLLDLAVPHEDVNPLVALWGEVAGDPVWSRLRELSVRGLMRDLGVPGGGVKVPLLPAELGAAGRYFGVTVFLAMLPHVRAYHRALGIPADTSRRTLADLGRNMAVCRRLTGRGGLLVPYWITLHFRGELYQLGRLQFQLGTVRSAAAASMAEAGRTERVGDPCLHLHIPDFSGPLAPGACAGSLAAAREFFPRHYPAVGFRVAVCESWLLDPQLRDHLPAHSNIIGFQDLFARITPGDEDLDRTIVRFVYGDADTPFAELPRRTSLERAVAGHLAAGRHWHGGAGWLAL
ncbi:acyltransferase domain-containing protein [Streptomyces sp. NPDC004111]|uniref:acyltransferase domain-containing protein n=1 Tax=Streptomyces sp. NPDC004111 TaxID=3364690 RepID=UPI0036B3576F